MPLITRGQWLVQTLATARELKVSIVQHSGWTIRT